MTPLLAATLIGNTLWLVGIVSILARALARIEWWAIGVKRALGIVCASQVFAALEAVLEEDWIGLGWAALLFGGYLWLYGRTSDDDDDIDRWRDSAREKGKALLRKFAPSPIPAPIARRSC